MSSQHTYFAELSWRVSLFRFMLALTLPPAFDFLKCIGQIFAFYATQKLRASCVDSQNRVFRISNFLLMKKFGCQIRQVILE